MGLVRLWPQDVSGFRMLHPLNDKRLTPASTPTTTTTPVAHTHTCTVARNSDALGTRIKLRYYRPIAYQQSLNLFHMGEASRALPLVLQLPSGGPVGHPQTLPLGIS